jgi:hypothetical protein
MNVTPRLVGLLSLAALVPAVAFVVFKSEWIVVVALVNIVLIAGSLAIALSPHEHEDGEDTHEPDGV